MRRLYSKTCLLVALSLIVFVLSESVYAEQIPSDLKEKMITNTCDSQCVKTINSIDNPELSFFSAIFNTEDKKKKYRAFKLLLKLGETSIPFMLEYISKNPNDKWFADSLAFKLKTNKIFHRPESLPVIYKLVKNNQGTSREESFIRAYAIEAIRYTGAVNDDVINYLLMALRDKNSKTYVLNPTLNEVQAGVVRSLSAMLPKFTEKQKEKVRSELIILNEKVKHLRGKGKFPDSLAGLMHRLDAVPEGTIQIYENRLDEMLKKKRKDPNVYSHALFLIKAGKHTPKIHTAYVQSMQKNYMGMSLAAIGKELKGFKSYLEQELQGQNSKAWLKAVQDALKTRSHEKYGYKNLNSKQWKNVLKIYAELTPIFKNLEKDNPKLVGNILKEIENK